MFTNFTNIIHFHRPKNKVLQSIVGSLNSLVWILRFDLQFLVFDITELHAQLVIEGYDISQVRYEIISPMLILISLIPIFYDF